MYEKLEVLKEYKDVLAEEFCEGSETLKDLLKFCWENDIHTNSSCRGHFPLTIGEKISRSDAYDEDGNIVEPKGTKYEYLRGGQCHLSVKSQDVEFVKNFALLAVRSALMRSSGVDNENLKNLNAISKQRKLFWQLQIDNYVFAPGLGFCITAFVDSDENASRALIEIKKNIKLALNYDYKPETEEEIKICKMIDIIGSLDNIRNNVVHSTDIDLSQKELEIEFSKFDKLAKIPYDLGDYYNCFEEYKRIEAKKNSNNKKYLL